MRIGSFVAGALAMLALLVLVALGVILTGGYNVAATERHSSLGEWALHTNFTNSVQAGASEIHAPGFTQAMVDAGAPEYKAMCAHCHGGVGEARAEWAEGMRPKPPSLAATADRWSGAEIFWLVKHGAKMTGMPAFGETHDDATLWNIAAFVKALPAMQASTYAEYSSEHGGGEGGHAHGDESAAPPEAAHTHAPGTPAHED